MTIADELGSKARPDSRFTPFRFAPTGYIPTFLGWQPWHKQQEVIDAYTLALRQQHERDAWERGALPLDDLETWKPGQVIQNWIEVDAGHNVGKTKLLAGLVSHFFDCYESIIYCFAPNYDQINDLLFKEIRIDREGKDLPGRVLLEPEIKLSANRFVKGKATNDAHGSGTERAQGQHHKYLMFVLDEAEGIPSFVWDAVKSMASGGISIVLIARNPRTTTCEAHKLRQRENVKAFRISELEHPNVLEDREIIPGSVRRQYVLDMLEGCEQVEGHNPDDYTFELPWQSGVIYRPSLTFLWRVLGIASSANVDDTFCPPGRYETATQRPPSEGDDPTKARLGIDCARYGNDRGTIYVRHGGCIWKEAEIVKKDGFEYYLKAKQACLELMRQGVTDIEVRLDAGGGYHSTCADNLNRDADLNDKGKLTSFKVVEVHNNARAYEDDKFADQITELYHHAGEALKVLRLASPSSSLEVDLCERRFKYVIKTDGKKTRLDLKQLVSKEKFRNDYSRSPDDGDGLVLATAPDHVFNTKWREVPFDKV